MKFKIKQEPRSGFTNTGHIILKKILNNGLPEMDILVRESIQNSLDAALPLSKFIIMNFKFGKFNRDNLLNCMPQEMLPLSNRFNIEENFLAIYDEKTCGLLGDYRENVFDKNAPANLYKLVYSFMRDKNDEGASGGSWGVGKSAYYRCGCGLCFYYSRTYEAGKYLSKLVGAYIEDESKDDSLLGKKSSGIAFFGEIDKKNESMPIYDDHIINEFLSIFGIKPYETDKTGTIVIIPFLDIDKLLSNTINSSNAYWKKDIEECLKYAIQRWYYPRLNNDEYSGKYLKASINDEKIILNVFFTKLQKLYNSKASNESIFVENIYDGKKHKNLLGFLKYKKFTKEELDVCCVPNNEPNPYIQLDIDYEDDISNKLIFSYVRKPGMIINYNNNEISDIKSNANEYIICVFVLNDSLEIGKEKLEEYVRKIENSDHYEWFKKVSKLEFPECSKLDPITKIFKNCGMILKGVFTNNESEIFEETSSTVLQKKLGTALLPPEDFGEKASLPPKKKREPSFKALSKSKFSVAFVGFENNGDVVYSVETKLGINEELTIQFIVTTNSKKYTFNEWSNFGFGLPFKLLKIKFDSIAVGQATPLPNSELLQVCDVNDTITVLNNGEENIELYLDKDSNEVRLINLKNNYSSSIKFGFNLILKPIDIRYTFSIKDTFKKVGDEN